MPTPQELLNKLEERFILAEISEASYLELKAKLVAQIGKASPVPSQPLSATFDCPSLSLAAIQGDERTVRMRLERGENPNQAEDGSTPLDGASSIGYLEIVKLLVARGAELEARNSFQHTPLHQAASYAHAQVADFLAKSGAKLSVVDKRLNTPLHLAAYEGHDQVIRVLLKHGASVNAENDCGITPLMGAVKEKPYVAAVQALVDAGADANRCDPEDKDGPLHRAASYGHCAIAKLLLDHGAKVNARNSLGQTPLGIALDYEKEDMVSLLKRHGGKK